MSVAGDNMRVFLVMILISNAVYAETAAVMRIRYERTEGSAKITGHGTAFGIDLRDFGCDKCEFLLTAKHNVLDDNGKPYKTSKVETATGEEDIWSRCKVIAIDDDLDLCLLEVPRKVPVLPLSSADAERGSAVTLFGAPRGTPVMPFQGVVEKMFHNGSARSEMRVEFDHGCSGGAVVQNGSVVGIAVAGIPKDGDLDKTRGLFLPVSAIRQFLKKVTHEIRLR